jgi:hypothetical protein
MNIEAFLTIHDNKFWFQLVTIELTHPEVIFSLSCVLLMLITVVVDFVFVLVKVVLQVDGTSCVSLKLHCKNKFT